MFESYPEISKGRKKPSRGFSGHKRFWDMHLLKHKRFSLFAALLAKASAFARRALYSNVRAEYLRR
jgi:hypothetical protein